MTQTEFKEQQDEVHSILPAVDPRVVTAKAYPRNLETIMKDLKFLIMNTGFFEKVAYALPRKAKDNQGNYQTKWIVGPSIYLAREVAKCMTNMIVEQSTEPVKPDDKVVTGVGMAYDLEKNMGYKVFVTKNISYQDGKRYNDDLVTLHSVAVSAIAARNAILALVPSAIIDECLKLAEDRIATADELKNPNKWVRKCQEAVRKLCLQGNATEKEVLALLEISSVEEMTQEHLFNVVRVTSAIFTKEVEADSVFGRNSKLKVKTRFTFEEPQ